MTLKYALFVLIFHCFLLSATAQSSVLSKKVSLHYDNTPLITILNDLQNRYKLNFTYFNNIPKEQPITLHTKKEPLGESLAALFQKAGLKYAVTAHSVVIQKKFSQLNISGQITDKETGNPLAYATVSIKDKPIGIVTNPAGEFGFLIPEKYQGDTLFVSMLGYQDYEIDLSKLAEDSDLAIVLSPQDQYLDEVSVLSDKDFVQMLAPKKKVVKQKGYGLFKSFSTHVHYSIDATDLSAFMVACGAGALRVSNNPDGNSIEIDAEIITTSLSKKQSQKFIDEFLRLYIEEIKDTVLLKSFFDFEQKGKNGKTKYATGSTLGSPVSKINLSIKLPPKLYLSVYDNSGSLHVKSLNNNIYLSDGSGELTVEDIRGDVLINDGSGGLSVKNVIGKVKIIDSSGEINLKAIEGNVYIKDKSGGIHLREISADSTRENSIYIRDRSGGISGKDMVGNLRLVDNSGGIILKNVEGSLSIKDASGNISVSDLDGEKQIRTGSGSVVVNGEDLKRKKKKKRKH